MEKLPIKLDMKCDLTPLVTSSCKGLEKLCELVFGGPVRAKKRKDALLAAQTEVEKAGILSGEYCFDGEKVVPALPIPNMPSLPSPLAVAYEQELNNLAHNLKIAQDILLEVPDDKISDTPITASWFARWRNEAKLIGELDAQQLWGKILAEEIKSPGGFSLKTLDILKNITKDQAELFRNMAKYIVHGVYVRDQYGEPSYFVYANELEMVDAELFVSTGLAGIPSTLDNGIAKFAGNGFAIVCRCNTIKQTKESIFTGIPLTRAGREIMKIVDAPATSTEEIIEICGSMLRCQFQFHMIKHIKAVPYIDGELREAPIYFQQAL